MESSKEKSSKLETSKSKITISSLAMALEYLVYSLSCFYQVLQLDY